MNSTNIFVIVVAIIWLLLLFFFALFAISENKKIKFKRQQEKTFYLDNNLKLDDFKIKLNFETAVDEICFFQKDAVNANYQTTKKDYQLININDKYFVPPLWSKNVKGRNILTSIYLTNKRFVFLLDKKYIVVKIDKDFLCKPYVDIKNKIVNWKIVIKTAENKYISFEIGNPQIFQLLEKVVKNYE
ncbi:hypothetical protein [Spiroplasma endosymbiont of Crioceris asparagi]|uniref:hypothetical protein n=1 Tax=Spiroplasma endosymbiont of Crioceris asparagi TaxID=3066286 RepID=UPI0030D5C0B3